MSRDELLEEFWPDVPVAAARNRLQVAISGVRRTFLDVTSVNIVEYAEGGYRINPALVVEVDTERFDRAVHAAAAAERVHDRDAARTAYREATALYRGDFAADAPFEPWTLLPRESLRLELVDALDRLSRIELADRRVDDCIATAHRMLDVDPCREDAHRLLMRCYAAQGRPYQALRQYEFCQRILRTVIDASPARDTTALYHAIRTGSEAQFAEPDGVGAGSARRTETRAPLVGGTAVPRASQTLAELERRSPTRRRGQLQLHAQLQAVDARRQLHLRKGQGNLARRGPTPRATAHHRPGVTLRPLPEGTRSKGRPVAELSVGRTPVEDDETDVPARPADRLAGIEHDEVVRGGRGSSNVLPSAEP